jgi:hypothetical protein
MFETGRHRVINWGRGVLVSCASLALCCGSANAQGPLSPEFRKLFHDVVLKHEYGAAGGQPLVRWEVPVHMAVHFGATVPQKNRDIDMVSIRKVVGIVGRASNHPVMLTRGNPNFHVFVVTEEELRNLGPTLQATAGLSEYSARAITRLQPNTNCLVVAEPEQDKSRGYRSAVAVIRADLPAQGRESCFYEEIAQGMGLPNDCKIRATIFNDDNEFARFTEMDLQLLRITYDRRLRSGMEPDMVMNVLDQILAKNG